MHCAQRLTVHIPEKGSFPLVMSGGGDIVEIGGRVEFPGVGQHPVPEVPAAAKGLLYQRRLDGSGVEADLDNGVLGRSALCGRNAFPVACRHKRLLPAPETVSLQKYTFANHRSILLTHIYSADVFKN